MKWGSAPLAANLDGNDSPALKNKLRESNQQLVQAFHQNEKLVNALYEAREAAGYEIQGEVVILKEQLDDERALVTLRADEEKVALPRLLSCSPVGARKSDPNWLDTVLATTTMTAANGGRESPEPGSGADGAQLQT
jgi:hypothetical protein